MYHQMESVNRSTCISQKLFNSFQSEHKLFVLQAHVILTLSHLNMHNKRKICTTVEHIQDLSIRTFKLPSIKNKHYGR